MCKGIIMSHNKLVPKQTVEVAVTGLGSTGEGVGKVDGFTVFAHGGLPGEIVKVRLDSVKKTYAMGEVTSIIKASADRCEPVCPIYEQCGGCQLQHLSYAAQLKIKTQQVEDALLRIGHLRSVEVMPTLRAENPLFYRNKMQFPVAHAEGKLEIGCFAAYTHKVVDVDNCFIQKEKNNINMFPIQSRGQSYFVTASSVVVAAATVTAATNITHYITDLSGSSDLATSKIVVKDGSTIVWQDRIGNTAAYNRSFVQPLRMTKGNAATVTVDGTTVCNVNVAGFSI